MRIAVLCESTSDEAGLRILIEAILGHEATFARHRFRSRGWPSVYNLLAPLIRHLYYNTDTGALAIVADSDDSPAHQLDHEPRLAAARGCRFCELQLHAESVLHGLRRPRDRQPLRLAIGVAVPALEAWYARGMGENSEEYWQRKLTENGHLRTNRLELKRKVYGTGKPTRRVQWERAKAAATVAAQDLDQLERLFPAGFGTFAHAVRAWETL